MLFGPLKNATLPLAPEPMIPPPEPAQFPRFTKQIASDPPTLERSGMYAVCAADALEERVLRNPDPPVNERFPLFATINRVEPEALAVKIS
jgi:hypothetical protein